MNRRMDGGVQSEKTSRSIGQPNTGGMEKQRGQETFCFSFGMAKTPSAAGSRLKKPLCGDVKRHPGEADKGEYNVHVIDDGHKG